MLSSLGFPHEAETVYRLLLKDPALSDCQLSASLGLTLEQAAQARAQLIEAGLIRASWEDDTRVVLVNPELFLDRTIYKRQSELARQQEEIAASRYGLQSLVTDYLQATAQPQPVGEALELVGIDAIRGVLETWSASVQHEVLALHPKSVYTDEELDAAEAMDVQALGRGVSMRSIYPESCRAGARTAAYHRAVTGHGAQIRYAKHVPTRMLVFDRQSGIIPLHSADNGRAAVLLRGEAITSMLVLTFEQAWSGAHSLGESDDEAVVQPAGTDPSDVDRTLLQLMSMGVKDEAAARHLGVSVRTVRRQIADLMTRLEAGSRFEAGMRAAMRGWVQPPNRP